MATEVAAVGVAGAPATGQVESKGLKKNAIGYVSNIVIGVASTAPAYSLAATLGFIVADPGVGVHAPGVLLAAFVPMFLVSLALPIPQQGRPGLRHHVRMDDARVRAELRLAQRLGDLPGRRAGDGLPRHTSPPPTPSSCSNGTGRKRHVGAALVGAILWIWLMTWICHRGIELSARVQQVLLGFEFTMLVIFAVVALVDVYSGNAAAHSIKPQADWFNPFAMNFGDLVVAMLLGIFIYWGWDSGVAVNEESEDSNEGPGRAAVVSTLLLVADLPGRLRGRAGLPRHRRSSPTKKTPATCCTRSARGCLARSALGS